MSSHTGQMRSRSGPGVVPLAVALLLLLASCALQDSVAPNDAPGTRGISADRSAGPAPNFYVSPTGSPSGDGSFTEPWDLATALAGPAAVTPGSTIWLRGGMYTNAADARGFASTLTGTPDAPIVVRQYPRERATVTNILFVTGAYTWFWGFEVTNPAPQQGVMHGVHLKGPGIKVINLVVHDATDDGIFIGPGAAGAVFICSLCLRPDEDSIIGRVMDDQVDDLDSGPFEVDPEHHALLRSGVRDLKTPKPRVRTSHEEDVGNRRTLPGILAHYDRSVRCTRQRAREAPRICGVRIHSAAQPDRAARRHRGRAGEGRCQVPWLGERSVAGWRAGRRDVKVRRRTGGAVGAYAPSSRGVVGRNGVLQRAGGQQQEKRNREGYHARSGA